MKRQICVFTGARAEYGLLKPLLDEIRDDPSLELQLVVTGMHLSPEFGLTYKVIEADGYTNNQKIEMILSSDTPVSICKSMALGLISFSECLQRLKPDLVVLLGDRFETMTAATACLVSRIPIAHIQGGELTIGATDDAMRHSITKMSLLHFTYTEAYRKRVIQLGEDPSRVFNVGGLNNEVIRNLTLLSKPALEKEIDFKMGDKCALVTFHPVTLEANTSETQFKALLSAMADISDLKIIFTKTNADAEGRIINQMIDEFVATHSDRSAGFTSLGQLRYLSAMKYCNVVVGNSSSGIIETPSYKKPTVNIGDREKGRIRAANIIDSAPDAREIGGALKKALSTEFLKSIENMVNPYDKDFTAKTIKDVLRDFQLDGKLKKEFFDFSL